MRITITIDNNFYFFFILSIDCVLLKSGLVLCIRFWFFLDFSCKKKIETWYLKHMIEVSEEEGQL